MKIKEFIRLFVPPIYYKVKKRLFPKKQPVHHPLPKVEHEKNRMVVIGNGPSLNKTVELYEKQLHEADCVMVNFSARTQFFEQIRPRYYMMADPGFINDRSIEESVKLLVLDLTNKTSWPMTIVMPDSLHVWESCAELQKNQNISILFYNNKGYNVPKNKQYEALDENLVGPPAQTVLNAAIWLSVYWGYKETYIVGADTSFIQDIYVGQKDNVLYTVDRHYYNNQEVCPEEIEPEKNGHRFGFDMEHFLDTVHTMYVDYKMLMSYADWKGVKVYNASEYSMIDCFERKKLK